MLLLPWERPGCRAAGEGEGMRQGREGGALQEHWMRPLCCLCALALVKWQIPLQSQQRGTAAPALRVPVWVCLGTCRAGAGLPSHSQAAGIAALPTPPEPSQLHGNVPECFTRQNVECLMYRCTERWSWLWFSLAVENLSPAFGTMSRGGLVCVLQVPSTAHEAHRHKI